ncbi:hypothetical protein G6M86_27160 (plasmid) [Agrobacterium tumefaciens]|uniref:Cyclic nucleotide-binding domain-containing protein n=1 Tax=Agrobacterium tumefaciens TaxID=358 RepID=A0AAJ4TD82_AGRTU|nr:hypothetical protein G6M86_27160 [Agrobacterium tumefaciens]
MLLTAILPLEAQAQNASSSQPVPGMTASVALPHLLANVPFFRELSKEQVQWVIDHSREWAVAPGTEIASDVRGGDAVWVLLAGAWRVENAGHITTAGNADPAKWYGGRDFSLAVVGQTRLVATATSHVLQIAQADLDEMIRQGFPVSRHLEKGLEFYRTAIK